MGLATLILGEERRDVVGYNLSVDDLKRATLPDSKLAQVTAEFTRSTPVGPVGYSFDYHRDPVGEIDDSHRGPYLHLSSHHWEHPLFAHAFKPAYTEDFNDVERVIAESVSGVLGKRNDFEMELGEKRTLDFFRYILLPNQLTREEFVRLLRNSSLKAENARIKFINFVRATQSEYRFQVEHESMFHW